MRKNICKKINKKGQVTIFIILGLLILSAALVVIFIKMNSKKAQLEQDFNKAISERPQFAKPVYTSVESCMQQLLKQGFLILGQQGGYIYSEIDPPTVGDFVNSQGVIYYGNTLPYWHYVPTATGQTAGFTTKSLTSAGMPALCKNTRPCMTTSPPGEDEKSVEGQLQKYIDENMMFCLDDFRSFTSQGYNVSIQSPFKSEVLIQNASKNVIVRGEFPIIVTQGVSSTSIEKYQSTLNFDFTSIYEKLYAFVTEEAQQGFIEEHMLRLLDSYSYTNKIPSYKQFEFFTDQKKWSVNDDIKPEVQSLIEQYVPQQKIMYTRNWENTVLPGNLPYGHPAEAHYRDMVFDVFNGTPNYMTDIYFDYSKSDFDFALWMPDSKYKSGDKIEQKGKLGDLTGIDFIDGLLGSIPIWELEASYYISYPVVVTFVDHDVFANDKNGDYTFMFAVESNIVNNAPIELSGASTSFYNMQDSVLCDPQLKTVPVNMSVSDFLFGTPVINAKVIFTCAGRSCVIGETNSQGKLNDFFPDCGGTPYLTVDQKDYMLKRFEQNIKIGTNPKVDITLQPKILQNYTVKKIKANDILAWKNLQTTNIRLLTNKATDLNVNDTVTLQFMRNQSGGFTERAYSANLGIDRGTYSDQPFELINGTYRVMGTLVTYQDVYIPMEFARIGNDSSPKRCKAIGKMSELTYLDAHSDTLGYATLNFSSNAQHSICWDEPSDSFWPNWGYIFLGVVTKWYDKPQFDDCNKYLNNYLTKKLPKFSQTWDSVENKTIAIQDGYLNSSKRINDTIYGCYDTISDAAAACLVQYPCGSAYDGDGNLRSDYTTCMNYQYYDCIKKYNGGADYRNFGICYFNRGFCNKFARWYDDGSGIGPSQTSIIPLYQMTDREYKACNLRSGFYNLGLDLGVYVNSSVWNRSEIQDKDFKGCVQVNGHVECSDETKADEYVAEFLDPVTIDGNSYRQFGLCLPGLADVFNNTNVTSNATIKIQEINLTGKPVLNGGFMANEATNVFWKYDPYTNNRYAKNLTFYVIELEYIPLYYEDFAQQTQIINYSAEVGSSLVRAFLP